jgi:acylphosphatase
MSDSEQQSVRLHILGRVQGVGYRVWTADLATDLGLRGWVRNRLDGTVETLISGDAAAVAAMIEACRRGPPAARVREVVVSDADDDGSVGFTARSTA